MFNFCYYLLFPLKYFLIISWMHSEYFWIMKYPCAMIFVPMKGMVVKHPTRSHLDQIDISDVLFYMYHQHPTHVSSSKSIFTQDGTNMDLTWFVIRQSACCANLDMWRPLPDIHMSLFLLGRPNMRCASATYNILIMCYMCMSWTWLMWLVYTWDGISPFQIHMTYLHERIYMSRGHLSWRPLMSLLLRSRGTATF